MKKSLLGFSALILAISLSAFTSGGIQKDDALVDYEWHKYNAAGTAELSPTVIFDGTAADARVDFGCPTSGSKTCGRAYDSNGLPLNIYITKP